MNWNNVLLTKKFLIRIKSVYSIECVYYINSVYFINSTSLMLNMYIDAMDNLAYNAVDETKIDSNGKTYTVNSDRWNIDKLKMITIADFANNNFEIISKCNNLKPYIVSYMKKEAVGDNLELVGPIIILYDSSYQSIYNKKLKSRKKSRIIPYIILIIALLIGFIYYFISK